MKIGVVYIAYTEVGVETEELILVHMDIVLAFSDAVGEGHFARPEFFVNRHEQESGVRVLINEFLAAAADEFAEHHLIIALVHKGGEEADMHVALVVLHSDKAYFIWIIEELCVFF
jgi:hypothetical protein